ncbi:hypothetical protein DBL02_00215 [Acinetobacter oleivorans]|uniref:hypothetical protein n=1 Tax=Acinetobacter oleivorans TaxID=1148157 RepID=UPI000D31F279|nr:hypothetical protein [Acinetobacter oleivorans]PTV47996.1 hypothetical protein DBL02_00215 [Acinetobacter oleivorans]
MELNLIKSPKLLVISLALSANLALAQSTNNDTTPNFKTNKLALNLDGSRHAYHPNNEGLLPNLVGGINQEEATKNRFTKNRGYGIAKKETKEKGLYEGYIQPNGYFVSQTTPYYKNKPESNPERYADAETIPYITLSPAWKAKGIKNCDIAYVENLDNGKKSAAIFTDYRNNDKNLEISLALAKQLEIPVYTKKYSSYDKKKMVTKYVGINNNNLKIYYFLNSGNGNGKTAEEIQQLGEKLMKIKK